MTLEPCIGCGRMILTQPIANLTVKCDPAPLTDVGEIVRLLTSPNPPSLWMVEKDQQGRPTRLRGARPGEPGPVREHRCTGNALNAPVRPVQAAGPTPPPKAPQSLSDGRVAPSTPSSGPSTVRSGARSAESRHISVPGMQSVSPDCSFCGHPVDLTDVDTYAMIELGAVLIDAFHTGSCP